MIDNQYWGLGTYEPIDTLKIRIEMAMSPGFEIIVPDRFIPHMELEPITEEELKEMARKAYWYKRANISKLRSIIRKCHNT